MHIGEKHGACNPYCPNQLSNRCEGTVKAEEGRQCGSIRTWYVLASNGEKIHSSMAVFPGWIRPQLGTTDTDCANAGFELWSRQKPKSSTEEDKDTLGPSATVPLVTSQTNSDSNEGTPLDSRERENDAVTWRRGKKSDDEEVLVTVPSPCSSTLQELSSSSPASPKQQLACCWYTSASCGRKTTESKAPMVLPKPRGQDPEPQRTWLEKGRMHPALTQQHNKLQRGVSVSMSKVATSKRLGLDRYLLSLNWFSNSISCWLVKAVLGLRHFPNKPAWSPSLGMIIPALIQGSSGSVAMAPFSCSGYGWTSCVKPGYMKAGCWPPKAARGYMEPGCIPRRPPWCKAVKPDWDKLKSSDLERTPGRAGQELVGLG
ncbi:hypothetical protein EYF80_001103 [Liparis tanakae]|uniref:Uncharacterized protein n=1 Tax=Liparis tanakae TaxID=230148 RepID=A0A4Z2JFG9_9TELE|nr:hypothetical protein EYF80_001103 [Liparis tanakae]